MATLDVSQVLLDPRFASRLQYTRNVQSISTGGIAANAPTTSSFIGVVTSSDGSILQRLSDGERIVDTIFVHSKTRLIDGQVGNDADEVLWQGKVWTVTNVNDYSHFGAGFVCATCEVKSLQG